MPVYALGPLTPEIHPTAYVHPDAVVIGAVRLGMHVSVWPSTVLRGDHGRIEVGDWVAVQDGTVVHGNIAQATAIGEGSVVGHLAHLEGCTVGAGCLVGSGSVVMPQAAIGDGAVVGAGAVVPRGMTVPAGTSALGVPARIARLGERRPQLEATVRRHAELAASYRTGLRRLDDGA